MADVTVGDVVRIVAEWDIPDGTIAQLVYHFVGKSGTTGTPIQVAVAMETALQAAWVQIQAEINQLVTGSTLEVLQWDFALNRWDGISSTPMVGIDGTLATHMLSHGAAALVKLFTEANRRQARKYVMGLTEDASQSGTIDGVALTALALFGGNLDNPVVAGGLTLNFGTFNTDPLSPLFETFSEAIQSVQAEAIVAYQRRRRPGTGI